MLLSPEQGVPASQLEQVLESIKDSVLRVDAHLKITLMNGAARRLFKVRQWQGLHISEVARVEDFVHFLASPNKEDDSSFEFEMLKGPHRRHVRARVTQQEDGGQVIVLRDVTTVRRLERMRRDFVANVSHELRTPISVVSANAETLLDGAMDDRETASRLLEAVHRNAERLTLIINDLLDLSRLEAGSYSLNRGNIHVEQVAKRVREALYERAEAKGAQVSVEIESQLSVITDEAALFQVLFNFLENAIKYTPKGSEIRFRAIPRKRKLRILVEDNGPGIPDGLRDRVFERFFRVDPGRSREMGGTGLGLSIVKHLAEAMGGRVGIADVAPSGSAFWIELLRSGES